MTEKPRETQAESHVVELKEKVNNSSLMKHRNVAHDRIVMKNMLISTLQAVFRFLGVSVEPWSV